MIVLDTHVAIWLLTAPEKITRPAAEAISQEGRIGGLPAISTVTLFELFYAQLRNRVQFHVSEAELNLRLMGWFRKIDVNEEIAIAAGKLDPFHGDPLDRLITATAIVHNCPLVTADRRIHEAAVCKAIW